MLVVSDSKGKRHIVAHFQPQDVPALYEMQRRFDSELAIWSSGIKEWIPISELNFDTANDWNPGDSHDPSIGEVEAKRQYG